MAAKITQEQHAARLARAILADIQLYNEKAVATAPSLLEALAEPLEEGKALYMSRVVPELVAVFDLEVRAWLLRLRPDDRMAEVAPPASFKPGVTEPTPAAARPGADSAYAELAGRGQPSTPVPVVGGRSSVLLLAGVVALIAGLVAIYLFA